MAKKEEPIYRHLGLQLRAIREDLKMTADAISKETGISRSYLSGFERGYRLPTAKYMLYLHNQHNVDLNYIFHGSGRKFRLTRDESPPDFGSLQEEVDRLMEAMAESRPVLFAVLGFFAEYELANKDMLDNLRAAKTKKNTEKNEK
jgi:transcriptional regulator with XRE-family HTH domain